MYWTRVPSATGGRKTRRSLETRDAVVARAMCSFLVALKDRRESYLLNALNTGTVSIGAAYDAFRENKLDALIATLRDGGRAGAVNVEPLIDKWAAEMRWLGKVAPSTQERYIRQVRTLIPEDAPFLSTGLTRAAIKTWLGNQTRGSVNRFHAAMSAFCRYLVDEAEVLADNPCLSIPYAPPAPAKGRYVSQEEAKRLIVALPLPYRAYHALAAATAMERQALLRLHRKDVDLDARTVFARGTKRQTRTRTCYVYNRWTWAWTIFTDWLRENPMLPDALVFAGVKEHELRKTWAAACEATAIADFTPHGWRNTWAVQALRETPPIDINTISRQLGHSNPTITLNCYARFTSDSTDFAGRGGEVVTICDTVNREGLA